LIAEAGSAQAALDGKFAVLLWLRSVLPPGGEQQQRINRALPPPPAPGVVPPVYQAPQAWIEAREALTRDADAPLPL
jgi:hypothetical protein